MDPLQRMIGVFGLMLIGGVLLQCAPYFGNIHTAKMPPPGTLRVVPHGAQYGGPAQTKDYSWEQYSYGGHIELGVFDDLSLNLTGATVHYGYHDGGEIQWAEPLQLLALGPKIGLDANPATGWYSAVYLPVGTFRTPEVKWGDQWKFQPMLLFTKSVQPWLDLRSATVGYFAFWGKGNDLIMGQDLGVDVHLQPTQVTLRTDVGIGYALDSANRFYQGSVGVVLAIPLW